MADHEAPSRSVREENPLELLGRLRRYEGFHLVNHVDTSRVGDVGRIRHEQSPIVRGDPHSLHVLELDVENGLPRGIADPTPQNKQAEMGRKVMDEEIPLEPQRKTLMVTDQSRASGLPKRLSPTVEHADVELLETRDQSPDLQLHPFFAYHSVGLESHPFGDEQSLPKCDVKSLPQRADQLKDVGILTTGEPILKEKRLNHSGDRSTTLLSKFTNPPTKPVTLGNLNMPKAQWKLTGQTGNTTPSAVGNFPATTTNVTFPGTPENIGGRSSTYAAFRDAGDAYASTTGSVIDTRKSFTISTWAKANELGGNVLSQDLNRSSSLLLFANHQKKVWKFALSNSDADSWPYDETNEDSSLGAVSLNTWTQLTAVYDHTTGLMRLYVNGTLAATGHHKASTSPAPIGAFQLGRFKYDGAYSPPPSRAASAIWPSTPTPLPSPPRRRPGRSTWPRRRATAWTTTSTAWRTETRSR